MAAWASAQAATNRLCETSAHPFAIICPWQTSRRAWATTFGRTRSSAFSGNQHFSAVDADLIGRSPARKVALPRIVRPEHRTLSPDDLRRLVVELPGHYQTLVLLAGVLGLAWEEAIALRVRDVDFARQTVTFAQTVEELAGHLTVVPEGKRPARLRTMATPAFLLDRIAGHLALYRTGAADDPDALVFIGPRGGVLRRRFGERILRPAAQRAGLEGLTFHGLRHAATSSLVDVGVHPRVMAARIGHGTVKTTMEIYARASNSADREAAALLQERFADAFPDVEHPDDLR